jgi:ankyrin repeat protein
MFKKIFPLLVTIHVFSTHAIKPRVEPKVQESGIHSAAFTNHHDCIRERAQAQPNGVNSLAWYGDTLVTPLHLAAMKGHADCVRELLAIGANPHIQDNKGDSAVHKAALAGSEECLELLLPAVGTVQNDFNTNGYSPLHVAAGKGFTRCVRMLLQYQADVNHIGGNSPLQVTPLLAAVVAGMTETARTLIEAGAHVMLAVDAGNTAIHSAAQEGYAELLELLLQNKGNANVQGTHGGTPLFNASLNGHVSCIEVLLRYGAQVNYTSGGVTTLHLAAQNNNFEVLKTLLAAGADPAELDSRGLSAAMIAQDPHCIMLLTEAEATQLRHRIVTYGDDTEELKARIVFLYSIRLEANKSLNGVQTSSQSSSSTQNSALCGQCGKTGDKRCARCKSVYYCSLVCQSQHWKTHKKECTSQKPG